MAWTRSPWFSSASFASAWWGMQEGTGSPGGSPSGSPGGSPSEPPVDVTPISGGGYRIQFLPNNRLQILREDDEIIAFLFSVVQSGMLH